MGIFVLVVTSVIVAGVSVLCLLAEEKKNEVFEVLVVCAAAFLIHLIPSIGWLIFAWVCYAIVAIRCLGSYGYLTGLFLFLIHMSYYLEWKLVMIGVLFFSIYFFFKGVKGLL